jgi:hypothetical protein
MNTAKSVATSALSPRRRGTLGRVFLITAALLLASCGTLQPAAPYDPEIEKTVSEFDTAVQAFLLDMQGKSGTDDGVYSNNTEFYAKWKVTLSHLRNRVVATDVGTSCGPDEEFDGIVKDGIAGLDKAMTAASDQVRKFNDRVYEPIEAKLQQRFQAAETRYNETKAHLDGVRARLEDLRSTLIPAGARGGGEGGGAGLTDGEKALVASLAPIRELLADAKAEYDSADASYRHWKTVVNRFRGVVAKATADSETGFKPGIGGCTTRMITYLYDQFESLERFHIKQEHLGIPPRAAPKLLMDVPVQVILKVQERKKYFHQQGVL